MRKLRIVPHCLAKAKAVQPRHQHVAHDRIGSRAPGLVESICPVCRGDDLEAQLLQVERQQLELERIIVGREDPPPRPGFCSDVPAGSK